MIHRLCWKGCWWKATRGPFKLWSTVSDIVLTVVQKFQPLVLYLHIFEAWWFVSTIVEEICWNIRTIVRKSCIYHGRDLVKPFVEKHFGWFMKQKDLLLKESCISWSSVQIVCRQKHVQFQRVCLTIYWKICKWFVISTHVGTNSKSFKHCRNTYEPFSWHQLLKQCLQQF